MFPASSMEHFSAHPPPDPKYSARFRRRYTGANYHQPDPGTQGLEVLTATGESVISLEGGHYLTRGERFARRIGQYYARGDFGQRKTLATSTQTWKLPPVPAAKIPQAVSFYVNVAGLHVAVKKYLYIPADLVRRFPSIGSSQEIVGRGVEKRIYLSHYQIIRLLKAISKGEPTDDHRFACGVYSQWMYSKWNADQAVVFIELIFDAGAPDALILDLCRPCGVALNGIPDVRTMQQWMNAFLTAAFYRGRLELAKQLAIRMDLYGMAVNIQKKLDERRDYHFWDYDAAATFVRREMRDDMKMQLKMREKSDTPLTNHPCAYASNRCRVTGTVPFINRHISICARKLPEVNCIPCRDCGLLLPPGAPDALHNLRHSANCERRTVVWTDDLLHTDVFEKPPFPPAGPLGQLYLVPADNVDRLVCQVFEHLADSGRSFMLRLSEVRRY